ncbi:hypothetical protein GCM10010468_19630 [Actinocorallia longicatena]|uniref:Mycofactocin n=1 Tax=Actinocorallia longicatena TaxID=111803 RepID=A0ABP6Q8D7_9ACTN
MQILFDSYENVKLTGEWGRLMEENVISVDEALAEELVEEVSIDGMCGVY